jgi:hypothetical protein
MDSKEFKKLRKKLNKSQTQMAKLLGVSKKAVHSYEQGWRNIRPYVEREMFFLLSRVEGNQKGRKPCWVIKKCPPETKNPAIQSGGKSKRPKAVLGYKKMSP